MGPIDRADFAPDAIMSREVLLGGPVRQVLVARARGLVQAVMAAVQSSTRGIAGVDRVAAVVLNHVRPQASVVAAEPRSVDPGRPWQFISRKPGCDLGRLIMRCRPAVDVDLVARHRPFRIAFWDFLSSPFRLGSAKSLVIPAKSLVTPRFAI
jgi:hypothetical protein